MSSLLPEHPPQNYSTVLEHVLRMINVTFGSSEELVPVKLWENCPVYTNLLVCFSTRRRTVNNPSTGVGATVLSSLLSSYRCKDCDILHRGVKLFFLFQRRQSSISQDKKHTIALFIYSYIVVIIASEKLFHLQSVRLVPRHRHSQMYYWRNKLLCPCWELGWVMSESRSPSDFCRVSFSFVRRRGFKLGAALAVFPPLLLSRVFSSHRSSPMLLFSLVVFSFRAAERECAVEVIFQQTHIDPWAWSLRMTKCHL